ncbi:MAG: extracellular solute-binding protein [Demequina sp.]|nr:extracellular solute-binding protein [Demequina sp.]
MTMASRKAKFVAAGTIGIALLIAGCTPGTAKPTPSDQSSATGGEVSTAVPSDPVTLTLAFTDNPEMTDALAAAFHEKYPQVTIETQFTQFADYVKSLRLSMSSDSAPDIAQYNAALKDLSAAGLVVDLTDYENAYGWDTKFPKSALDMLRVDETGKILGTGSLIAVPGGLSLVGLYYNKDLMEQAGISAPPTSVDELTVDLEKAQAAGITGLSLGGLDYGSLHAWAGLMNSMTNTSDWRDWINGKAGADIVTADAIAATTLFADWAKKGYFPESANGTTEADSAVAFAKGDGLFLVDGNWDAAAIGETMGDNVGFTVFPPNSNSNKAVGTGFSVSYMISSKSENQAAAAAFLDFLSSPEAAVIESNGGFLPPNAKAAPPATGIQADLKAANETIVSDDGLTPFPDFAAPAMLDSLTSGLQQVVAGRMEPKEFLESLQKVWTAYHGG